ncbi:MFS transporter [Ottowia sp. VDI28]|uniref:MFS transporter n=1 Tax=Ottowia sp. VDI28 TaxID=3133968 RepID=UPI003C2C88DB
MAEGSAPSATAPGPWTSLAVTTAIQVMTSMALLTLPVMAPEVAKALGVSSALVGGYIALAYAAAMAGSLVGGTLVRRMGAIRVSQMGLVSCAAGLALCSLPSLPAIVVGALAIGIGYGPITPASSHLLALTTPAHRMSLVFSIKQTGVPAGGMLAGAIVPGALLIVGWQATLLLVAAVCLVWAVLAQPLRAPLDADRQPNQPLALGVLLKPLRMVLGHRTLAALALCSFLFSAVQVSLTTYLVTYLHDSLSMTLVAAGVALSVSQLAGVVGRIIWGSVADRWLGARRTLVGLSICMVIGALFTAMLQPDTPVAVLWLVVGIFGASGIGWNGVYLAEVARQAPQGQASAATGGTLLFTFLGVVCGAPALGALSSAAGSYRVGFAALAVPALAALVLLLWRARHSP